MQLYNYRFILLLFIFNACTSHNIIVEEDDSFAGSINKILNPDQGIRKTENDDDAPFFIDYSKSNPLLRHDVEFDENKVIDQSDPFEEKTTLLDKQKIERLKAKREAERFAKQQAAIEAQAAEQKENVGAENREREYTEQEVISVKNVDIEKREETDASSDLTAEASKNIKEQKKPLSFW